MTEESLQEELDFEQELDYEHETTEQMEEEDGNESGQEKLAAAGAPAAAQLSDDQQAKGDRGDDGQTVDAADGGGDTSDDTKTVATTVDVDASASGDGGEMEAALDEPQTTISDTLETAADNGASTTETTDSVGTPSAATDATVANTKQDVAKAGVISCRTCSLDFLEDKYLQDHLKHKDHEYAIKGKAPGQGRYRCYLCWVSYHRLDYLEAHLKRTEHISRCEKKGVVSKYEKPALDPAESSDKHKSSREASRRHRPRSPLRVKLSHYYEIDSIGHCDTGGVKLRKVDPPSQRKSASKPGESSRSRSERRRSSSKQLDSNSKQLDSNSQQLDSDSKQLHSNSTATLTQGNLASHTSQDPSDDNETSKAEAPVTNGTGEEKSGIVNGQSEEQHLLDSSMEAEEEKRIERMLLANSEFQADMDLVEAIEEENSLMQQEDGGDSGGGGGETVAHEIPT